MKVAFFDRDGTIIRDYPDDEWTHVQKPEFMEGSLETLRRVQEYGYQIIIITNQYIINEGFITPQQYEDITNQMLGFLKNAGVTILDIFHCPHRRDEGCDCIKPNQGMIAQAMAAYPEIDIKRSVIIGDSACDMELARNIGMKGIWISEKGSGSLKHIKHVKKISDVLRYI